MGGVEDDAGVPDRPGWWFGPLERVTDPTGDYTIVSLNRQRPADGNWQTLTFQMRGRPQVAAIVPVAQARIDEWEAAATPDPEL